MGNKKKMIPKDGGAHLGFNRNELRTAGIAQDDYVEISAQSDRIIIMKFKER